MPAYEANHREENDMKKWICALLALMLMAMPALAESRLAEAVMIYEDYDDNHLEQTIEDSATLEEIEGMLLRASRHPAQLEGCTLNITLLCMLPDGDIVDFAVATDGCPYIVSNTTGDVYEMEDDDLERFHEIFDVVFQGMGYDASDFFIW